MCFFWLDSNTGKKWTTHFKTIQAARSLSNEPKTGNCLSLIRYTPMEWKTKGWSWWKHRCSSDGRGMIFFSFCPAYDIMFFIIQAEPGGIAILARFVNASLFSYFPNSSSNPYLTEIPALLWRAGQSDSDWLSGARHCGGRMQVPLLLMGSQGGHPAIASSAEQAAEIIIDFLCSR